MSEYVYKPDGVMEFLSVFLDGLRIKKMVALFDNYGDAKADLVLDMEMRYKLERSDMLPIIEHWEKLCDMEGWFSDLGKSSKNRVSS